MALLARTACCEMATKAQPLKVCNAQFNSRLDEMPQTFSGADENFTFLIASLSVLLLFVNVVAVAVARVACVVANLIYCLQLLCALLCSALRWPRIMMRHSN